MKHRPTWPIGTEVVWAYSAYSKDPSNWEVWTFFGYPKRARTRAKFGLRHAVCPTCGTANALVQRSFSPSGFIPISDPDLSALRAAWQQYRVLNELSVKAYEQTRDDLTRNGILPSYQEVQDEWRKTAARFLADQSQQDWQGRLTAILEKHHGS